jgi:predicted PurR-regulated permease PerM
VAQSGNLDQPAPAGSPAASGAVRIVATAAVLGVLYLARDVLVPVTLAIMLSFLMLPLVHGLRRVGLGQTVSVVCAVLCVALAFFAIAVVLGSQLVRVSAHLPQYEATLRDKADALQAVTVGHVSKLLGADSAQWAFFPASGSGAGTAGSPPSVATDAPLGSLRFVQRVLASIWVPLETAGTVLIVLIFVLLEHEALRDRLIRIAGAADIRATTHMINDAGARLSRFFVSQFLVNVGVGICLWLGLALVRLPHAILWASVASVLRFVPYIGIWIAAVFAVAFGAAVEPGWSLAIVSASTFLLVELVAGQLIEPQLFGHTTGLSPLSVVVAAIFWSWLWGPIGLILSTPVTLCLLVVSRNSKTLNLLDVLLGDLPALTMPQRFYQRALSGDSREIIAGARQFLKRSSFAIYCDRVVMPAMYLAGVDFEAGSIDKDQQLKVRNAVTAVIGALGSGTARMPRRERRVSVLDDVNLGRALRAQRQRVYGVWQGPVQVPDGSIALCVGLGTIGDELAAEILVRVLRDRRIDARHVLIDEIERGAPDGASGASVALAFVVSASPGPERARGRELADRLRTVNPALGVFALYLPGFSAHLAAVPPPAAAVPGSASGTEHRLGDPKVPGVIVTSFREAEAVALARYARETAVPAAAQ